MKTQFCRNAILGAIVIGAPLLNADDLVKVDKDKREVRVAAEATKRTSPMGKQWPIEVFFCVERGKMHETVFHTTAKPSEIHKALEAIGLKKGEPALPADATENGKYQEPKGDKVDVFIEWTDADGKTVTDGKVGAGDVVATIYQAVGINPKKNYRVGPRPVPLVAEDAKPIQTVLA